MTTITRSAILALAAALAIGCSAGDSAAAAPRVTVTRQITSSGDGGEKTTAPDEAVVSIAAIVPAAGGGATRLPATAAGPGVWRIADVPEGPYLVELRLSTSPFPLYYATSADQVDLGVHRVGNPPALPTASTPVTFALSGLLPWGAGDALQLYSADAALWNRLFPESIPDRATSGAETFDFLADEKSAISPPPKTPLLDSTDDLWVVQSRWVYDFAMPYGYETAVAAGRTVGTATPDGASTTLDVDLRPVTAFGTLAADWRTSAFEGLVEGVDDASHALNVSAVPAPLGVPTPALDGPSIDLFEAWVEPEAITTPTGDLEVEGIRYGRFLPSAFREFRSVSFGGVLERPFLGTALTTREWVEFRRVDAMSGAPRTIEPLVGPVRNVRIAGRDAMTPQQEVGPTPAVTWEAPRVGTATSYELTFRELWDAGDGTARSRIVARIVTGGTSVVVPPDVLRTGQVYVLHVRARSIADDDPERAPTRVGLPYGDADRVTQTFTP